MEKEEKKADLEQLLNMLIQRGWKPFGRETRHELSSGVVYDTIDFKGKGDIRVIDRRHHHIRELVAKESGLWQFCVENKLVNKYADVSDEEEAYIGKWKSGLDAIDIDGDYIRLDDDYDEYHQDTDYKYWLIECALKDESELEDFLLSNIVIKDEE